MVLTKFMELDAALAKFWEKMRAGYLEEVDIRKAACAGGPND